MLAHNISGSSIITDLETSIEGQRLLFFSILFTSDTNKVTTGGHFHFAIQKTEDATSAIEQVSDGLALCAYATFFYGLIRLRKNALEETERLVVSAKENMLYLASMAHAEGDTVFNTINNWFNLLNQNHISKRLSEKKGDALDFDFIANLSSLITTDFLTIDTNKVSSEFTENVQRLNSFELFEDNINYTFCPPSPGDIYEIDSKLYILAGQDCDLIVRVKGESVGRKEKLAELILCDKSGLLDNKIDDKTGERNPSLAFNYFSLNNEQGSLKIRFGERGFFDFRLLDLCSTNRQGKSQFSPEQKLDNVAKKALPKFWGQYYPVLIENINRKIKVSDLIKEKGISSDILSSDMSFSLEYSIEGDLHSFPVRRIAQLKGQFKDYFLRRYWEYKTRKGLNTTLLNQRQSIEVKTLECGFAGILEKVEATLEIFRENSHNRDVNKENLPLIINKEKLILAISEQHKPILERFEDEEITIKHGKLSDKSTKIDFDCRYEDGSLHLSITFPYYNQISKNHFRAKEKMALKDIFPSEFIETLGIDNEAICQIGSNNFPLFNLKRPHKFCIEDLKNGVVIPSVDLSFKLDNKLGILNKIELVEENC